MKSFTIGNYNPPVDVGDCVINETGRRAGTTSWPVNGGRHILTLREFHGVLRVHICGNNLRADSCWREIPFLHRSPQEVREAVDDAVRSMLQTIQERSYTHREIQIRNYVNSFGE